MVTYQCVLPRVRTSCTQVYHHAFSEVLTTDSIEVLQTYLGTELQNLLVRAKRRVAGWVAGGCWDDDITSDYGSFPHSLLSTSKWAPKRCGKPESREGGTVRKMIKPFMVGFPHLSFEGLPWGNTAEWEPLGHVCSPLWFATCSNGNIHLRTPLACWKSHISNLLGACVLKEIK